MVEFTLPARAERERMIAMYVDKYLSNPPPGAARRIVMDPSFGSEHVAAAVDATDGFSGREISKLAIAWQATAYGSVDATFTPALMTDVLEVFISQRKLRATWDEEQSKLR